VNLARAVAPSRAPSPGRAASRVRDAAEREAEQAGAAAERATLPTRWSFSGVPVSPPPETPDARATDAVGGAGRHLDPRTRRSMEARFRLDLRSVRVHDDARAAAATRATGAEALTVGEDIAVGHLLDTGSPAGRGLLAHELAHVAQQRVAGSVATVQHKNGGAPASPATTLEGLPEGDRKKIQAITTHIVVPDIAGKFATTGTKTTIPLPTGVTAEFDTSVDAALQHGLSNVAGSLVGTADFATAPLTPNSTITLELDLGAKLGKGLFRFTYHAPTAPPAAKAAPPKRVVVEALGKATMPPGTKAPPPPKAGATPTPDPVAEKITKHSLSHSYKDRELDALRAALDLIPDAQLALVSGLKFARDTAKKTDPTAAGDYDPKTHTVTMFDRAFEASEVRFKGAGTVTASPATRAIAHEIGHAIDLVALRKAGADKDKADAAVAQLPKRFPDPKDKEGWHWENPEQKKEIDAVLKAQKDAEKGLVDARSRSGTRTIKKPDGTFTEEIGKAAKGNAFREAAVKDGGKAVSKYGETDWQEAYAEAYSLYVTSPDTLRAVRPNVFAHFDSRLPK
jgi:Domain of unknown function (DUF4157)